MIDPSLVFPFDWFVQDPILPGSDLSFMRKDFVTGEWFPKALARVLQFQSLVDGGSPSSAHFVDNVVRSPSRMEQIPGYVMTHGSFGADVEYYAATVSPDIITQPEREPSVGAFSDGGTPPYGEPGGFISGAGSVPRSFCIPCCKDDAFTNAVYGLERLIEDVTYGTNILSKALTIGVVMEALQMVDFDLHEVGA